MRIILVFDEQMDIPTSVLFFIQAPTELLRIVLHQKRPASGDRTNFVQEEPLNLQC